MTPLLSPTIHLNGTSKRELVEQRLAVMEAARELLKAMQLATPSARDYYPQGPDAGALARVAWSERVTMVAELLNEIEMDAVKLALEGL